jgi:hypothetical protein
MINSSKFAYRVQSDGSCIVSAHNIKNGAYSTPLVHCKSEAVAKAVVILLKRLQIQIRKLNTGSGIK